MQKWSQKQHFAYCIVKGSINTLTTTITRNKNNNGLNYQNINFLPMQCKAKPLPFKPFMSQTKETIHIETSIYDMNQGSNIYGKEIRGSRVTCCPSVKQKDNKTLNSQTHTQGKGKISFRLKQKQFYYNINVISEEKLAKGSSLKKKLIQKFEFYAQTAAHVAQHMSNVSGHATFNCIPLPKIRQTSKSIASTRKTGTKSQIDIKFRLVPLDKNKQNWKQRNISPKALCVPALPIQWQEKQEICLICLWKQVFSLQKSFIFNIFVTLFPFVVTCTLHFRKGKCKQNAFRYNIYVLACDWNVYNLICLLQ